MLAQELFNDIQEKGVLLFSKKGDAYRFCFTAQDGKTTMVSPQQALTLFKATKDDKTEKVSENFYTMYERAKAESGVVKTSKTRSKNAQEALGILRILQSKVKSESEKEYLKSLCDVINWDSLPTYYIKKLSSINPTELHAFTTVKEIIPDSYLETLIQKENKIGAEPETVLLAEELI